MTSEKSNEQLTKRYRTWIIAAAVVGTGLWAGYFFGFLVYQSLYGVASPDNWFLQMIQQHPAATIGVGISAITAFCLVGLLDVSRGAIEFEVLGSSSAERPAQLFSGCFVFWR